MQGRGGAGPVLLEREWRRGWPEGLVVESLASVVAHLPPASVQTVPEGGDDPICASAAAALFRHPRHGRRGVGRSRPPAWGRGRLIAVDLTPPLPTLVDRVRALRDEHTDRPRVLVGLVGEPGAGKSTVAAALVEALRAGRVRSALVPMDGFHLAEVALARRGSSARKGALDTFDGDGFVALLRRLRDFGPPEVVHAPTYDRSIEESVAGAIEVGPEVEVIVTEGNYLLCDDGAWAQVGRLLDETWFVDVDPHLRRERLVARHVRHGKTPDAAARWVETVDEPNAALIRATASRADLMVDMR